jgi:hypothetical protein
VALSATVPSLFCVEGHINAYLFMLHKARAPSIVPCNWSHHRILFNAVDTSPKYCSMLWSNHRISFHAMATSLIIVQCCENITDFCSTLCSHQRISFHAVNSSPNNVLCSGHITKYLLFNAVVRVSNLNESDKAL